MLIGVFRDITESSAARDALRRSEERFRQVAETARDFIWEVDPKGLYLYASPVVEEILGYSPEEIVGRMHFYDFFVPENREEMMAAVFGAFVRREPLRARLDLKAGRDGKIVTVETIGVPLHDAHGNFLGYCGSDRDFTERRRAEEAIQASEKKHRALIETTGTGYLILDPQGRVIDANPEYVRLTGHEELAEILGRQVTEWTAPHDRERNAGEVRKCFERGFVRNLEIDYVDRHEKVTSIEINATVIGSGDSLRVLSLCRDITERKIVKRELVRQSEFIQAALDNISDGVVACDSAGDLALFNRAAREWHGLDALKLPADQWSSYYDLFGPDGVTPLATESLPLRRAFRGEHFHDVSLTIAAKGQPLRHVQASGRPFHDIDGQKLGAVVAIHDVTERKQAEQALRDSEERFRATFEQAAVGLAHVAPNGRFLRINRKFCQITGYSQEQLLERRFQEITHPDDIDIDVENIGRLLRGEIETYSIEKRCIPKDGNPVWVNLTRSLVRNQAGDPEWFVSVVQDVTERKHAITALRESEERFRNMADTAPVMIWVSGTDKLCTFFNKPWLDFTGRTLDQELGDGWAAGVYPEDLDRCAATYVSSFDARLSFQMEYRLRRADGEYRWVLVNGIPLWRDGEFAGYIASCIDVSDRKMIEERLRASEARLLGAQRLAKLGNWERHVETGTIRWSDEMFRIFGLENEAPPTLAALLMYIHPRDREKFLQADSQVCSGNASVEVEYRMIRPDGEVRFLRGILEAIRNDQGAPVRIVGTTQDITELVKTRESLRESEDRLKRAERIAHLGHWHWDIPANRVSGSEEMFRIFGEPPDYVPSYEGFLQDLLPQDREKFEQLIGDSLTRKVGHSMEYRVAHPNGNLKTISCIWEMLLDEEGLPAQMFGTCQDITDFKRAQKTDFERQKLETVGTLAGGIAHDFNNLLGAVLAHAEVAMAELADGSYPVERLMGIEALAIRGSDIVRQLMIYAGQEAEAAGPVDISRVLEEMLGLLKISVSKHARLEADHGGDLPAVWANAAQIGQIVMNLVTNASDAIGAQDGVIRVTTKRVTAGEDSFDATREGLGESDYVQLEVSDTGRGMTVETQAKVFDPFFTTKSGGHGLGLAVVHGIVRSLGGAIKLSSAPGKGTTFHVLLPCAAAPSLAPSPMSPTVPPAPDFRAATILVVEDEDALRQPVSKLLRNMGLSVIEASDGSAALEAIREHKNPMEFLLLDVTLPGASSQEVLEEAGRLRPEMKVIVTSAYSKDAAAASLHAKVEHFLRKPYQIRDLVDLLRRTCGLAAADPFLSGS